MFTKDEIKLIALSLKDYALRIDKDKEDAFLLGDINSYTELLTKKTTILQLYSKVIQGLENE